MGAASGFFVADATMRENTETQQLAESNGFVGFTHTELDAVRAPMRHLAHGPGTGPLRHNYEEWFVQLHHLRFNDHVA